jgi:hypothetical protein
LGAHALGIDLRAAVERYVDPRNGNFPLFVHRDLHHRGDASHEAIVRSDAESLSGRKLLAPAGLLRSGVDDAPPIRALVVNRSSR